MNPLFLGGLAGNLIGGYLMGQRQREMQMENQEMEQKKLKILMEAQKIKDAAEERRAAKEERESSVLDQIIQLQMGKAMQKRGMAPAGASGASAPVMRSPGLDFADSFGADSSSARAAAQPQAPAISIEELINDDPVLAVALEKRSGVPWTKVVEAKRKAEDTARENAKFGWQQNMDLLRGQGVTYVDVVDPATNIARKVPMPTNPALAGMVGGMPQLGGNVSQTPMPPVGLPQRPPAMGSGAGGGMISSVPKAVPEEYEQDGEKWVRMVNEFTRQPWPGTVPHKKEEAKPGSTETAGKLALANQAVKHISTINSMLFDEKGNVNRNLILKANAPMGGLGDGRKLRSMYLDALDARKRAASGAALTADEVTIYDQMYWPSSVDPDDLVKDKTKRLRGFMDDYLSSLDPSKSTRKRMDAESTTSKLPLAARKMLKEGIVTQFANGEKWTLRNGVEVPVP